MIKKMGRKMKVMRKKRQTRDVEIIKSSRRLLEVDFWKKMKRGYLKSWLFTLRWVGM
jgi:hypothetical protein